MQYGSRVGPPPVSLAELAHEFWIGTQFARDLTRARRHDRGIAKSMLGSFFQRTEIPFPVQAKIQTHIEDGGRVKCYG
jgi:hypothetical protein